MGQIERMGLFIHLVFMYADDNFKLACGRKPSQPPSKYYCGDSLKGLRKPMINLRQNNRCSGRDLNQCLPEYKSEVLTAAVNLLSMMQYQLHRLFSVEINLEV